MKKIGLLLFLLTGTLIYSGCDRCPEVLPYLEINKISCEVWSNSQLPSSDTLTLFISGSQISYLATEKPMISIFPKAYALSCETNGYRGLKHGISQIEITSNQTFDSNHVAGTLLNDLFLMEQYTISKSYVELTTTNVSTIFIGAQYTPEQKLILATKPDSLTPHIFNIKLTTANGVVLSTSSPEISWN